jgi:polyhydroxyalkanoate synthesis regulator phasin
MNKYFSGSSYQKGYGLGGIKCQNQRGGFALGGLFSKFYNYISPYFQRAKSYALPMLKTGAKTVGQEVLNTVHDIAKDIIDGKDISESAKSNINNSIDKLSKVATEKTKVHFNDTIDQLKNKIDNVKDKFVGRGYKNKRKKIKIYSKHRSKKRKLDIFD